VEDRPDTTKLKEITTKQNLEIVRYNKMSVSISMSDYVILYAFFTLTQLTQPI